MKNINFIYICSLKMPAEWRVKRSVGLCTEQHLRTEKQDTMNDFYKICICKKSKICKVKSMFFTIPVKFTKTRWCRTVVKSNIWQNKSILQQITSKSAQEANQWESLQSIWERAHLFLYVTYLYSVWSVVVLDSGDQEKKPSVITFTTESPAGFVFSKKQGYSHIRTMPPKTSSMMLQSKAQKPEQQHWSCSLAKSTEIIWKLCDVKQRRWQKWIPAVLLLGKFNRTGPPSENATQVRRAPTSRHSATTWTSQLKWCQQSENCQECLWELSLLMHQQKMQTQLK